jgi:pyridoxine 5'-phosphate synthase PdxJ
MTIKKLRLSVNIDHVAAGGMPAAASVCRPVRRDYSRTAGADGITAHHCADRRHISDADVRVDGGSAPLNFEMAATVYGRSHCATNHTLFALCRNVKNAQPKAGSVAREEMRLRTAPLRDAGCRVDLYRRGPAPDQSRQPGSARR